MVASISSPRWEMPACGHRLNSPVFAFWGETELLAPYRAVGPNVPPGFVVSVCIAVEPLFGVIEGVSAGLFLIGMLVAVVALFICRRKTR